MRYRADDVYDFLTDCDYMFEGTRYRHGHVWTCQTQIFLLPDPAVDDDGSEWFDADALEENLKDRWLPLHIRDHLTRYPYR